LPLKRSSQYEIYNPEFIPGLFFVRHQKIEKGRKGLVLLAFREGYGLADELQALR
jgi:hypothetical protein